jgi:hypothetical protein
MIQQNKLTQRREGAKEDAKREEREREGQRYDLLVRSPPFCLCAFAPLRELFLPITTRKK